MKYKRWFKWVERFCAKFDEDIDVTCDDDNAFASYAESRTVIVPHNFKSMHPVTIVGTTHFLKHVKERHHFSNPYRYGDNLWSILHELGHIYTTRFDVPSEGLTQYREMKKGEGICLICQERGLQPSDYEFQALYFETPFEFNATEWAVAWVKKHPIQATIWSIILG